ncbi:MAG: AI-2E family transporter [Betaproteobacteria bacterium]|nr:MAG: AI-2E family transporter [Betaproteobacteria bacterium]
MRNASLVALLVVTAVLYFARDVLIPLALAILLSFLLAPAVRHLERWKLGRVLSTAIVVLLGFSVIGGIGWVAGGQAIALTAKLPEYRANVQAKMRVLRDPSSGTQLGKAAEAIKDLEKQADPAPQRPMPVTETPKSPFAQLAEVVTPFTKPFGTALAVIVFTILLLLHRENMRERLIGLIGARRINVTTQALGEASYRVSRYLFMQLVVNACFGIPFGVALYFIGIPNAMLWGLLATLLRFIPYAGVWIAVSMPVLLAFAISDGWSQVAWVLGVFLALELLLVNLVEPWLYSRSAGLSPIAVIAAALFWTWLWGPVGLLLAMPLTVCVAVIGRHIPEMGYLNVLLGVEPVLTPEARFYQRLVAMDQDEAEELAESHANEKGLAALHAEVVIPALGLAEQDRHAGTLDETRARFILDTTRRIVEYVEDRKESQPQSEAPPRKALAPVCLVAASDEADHVAAAVLARMLPASEFNPRVIPFPLLAAETVEQIAKHACKVVCISAIPPQAATPASYLCKRLKHRLPDLKVLVALWTSENTERASARLRAAGADVVVTGLTEAIDQLRELTPQNQGRTTISRPDSESLRERRKTNR